MNDIPQHRVVVTGMGAVTPLGVGVSNTWKRLIQGETAISEHSEGTLGISLGLPRLAAKVSPTEWDQQGAALEAEMGSSVKGVRCILFALAAAEEALADASLKPRDAGLRWQERAGVCVGTGIGSMEQIADAADVVAKGPKGHRRLSPFFVPRTLSNLAAGQLSIRHGLKGPNHACTNACATGANSIGDAFRFIQRGDADVMVAGGTESCIHPVAVAGFARMRALCVKYTSPAQASRPFDSGRSGFVIGEGAALLVLERLEHALDRGAHIYAEVRGYGVSADANHVTAPAADGNGAMRCMQGAMRRSGISLAELGYINAHATSTPLGDEIEARAIAQLLGTKIKGSTPVSSTKGATGHLLGAAGSLEALFAVLAIQNNTIPPTLNLEELSEPIKELGLDIVGPNGRQGTLDRPIRAALSNSFGFGGTNASLLFGSYR